jgi:hypothetical protein
MATGRIPTTANSPLTAKGDLFTFSTGSAKLAVGSNGDTLVADSAATTGLNYIPLNAAGKNKIINGNFDIWQRGTSFAAAAAASYSADRWKTVLNGTGPNVTISRDTSVPSVASQYSLKMQQLSTSFTSVTEFAVSQLIETTNALTLFGKSVTLSFWYKSNLTGSHYVRFYTGGQTGGTDTAVAFTVNAADTWEYKTITTTAFSGVTAIITSPTAMGAQLDIGRRTYLGGTSTTIAANDYFQISQMQLETGSVATAFQTATGTIQGELAACQRYYWRNYTNGSFTMVGTGAWFSTTQMVVQVQNPVPMRIPPTAIEYSTLYGGDAAGGGSVVTPSTSIMGVFSNQIVATTGSAVGTTFRPSYVRSESSGVGYIGLSAEL